MGGKDEVDASDSASGIYFNMHTGSIVGLDQSTDRGSTFGAAGWIPRLIGAVFEPTDISITDAESVIGSQYSDALFGRSGSTVSDLRGGGGGDLLVARGAGSNLWGGTEADVFHIGSNTVIKDAETTGDSVWMGLPIFGGSKQWWMEGNKAYWSPFSTLMTAFPVIGSEILAAAAFFVDVPTMKFASFQMYEDGGLGINIGYGLGGVAKIEDYRLDLDSGAASSGVVVFEANRAGDASSGFQDPSRDKFTQFINLALKAGFGVGFSGWDPIVLDLDGDGYELTTQRNSGVYSEFDGDRFAEKTGWVRGDDGFLVLDASANGIVDDASEFFGDETQGGFAELATHDLNSDGVIDASDAVFADLRVWRDLDGDGVTDAGELSTLTDLGIASIGLTATAPAEPIDIGGNTIAAEATVTLTDGSTTKAGDAVLDISHIDTRYITGTTVSAAAAGLPQLRGFGNVANLDIAMSEDSALLAQVDAFDQLSTSDLLVLKQAAENILYAWAGVDGVVADQIGANGFDMRKLAFLEKFSGQEIAPRDPQTGAVSTAGLGELEDSWADTLQSLTLRLVVQSAALPAFAGMTYRDDLDLIVMGAADTLKDVYSAILTGLPTDPAAALAQWEDWGELLRSVQDGSRRFDNNIVRDDFAAAQLQAAIAQSGTSFDLAALAPAVGITGLRVGSAGAEVLQQVDGGTIFSGLGNGDVAEGGTGQDVYLLARGFGAVTIDDEEGAKMGDRIRFVDIDRSEVTAARVGSNLVLTVAATGDTVTVLGQFADVVALSSDVIISNNRGIEEIQFADGAIMELPDIAIAVGEGTSGDDVMQGTMHTDVFQGRAGNDLLMGGDDADLYVFDLGDGADTIREVQTTPLLMAADMVIFGDDIAPEDLVFSRGTDTNDLVITIGTGGDSVTIDNQFAYSSLGYNHKWSPNTRVEIFSFRHYGDVYTNKDIQQQLIASATTDGDDVTRGFGDDDFFGPSLGNDTFIGLDGNDTYFFGRGFGNDTIDEQAIYIDVNVGLGGLSLEHGADTIVFAPDIDLPDVTFSRLSSAPHLTITLDTGETLTVKKQFNGFQTGVLGSQWFDRMEWFEFADGTRLSWQDVLLDITTGTDGDDSLWGDLYEDTLTGGLGNDYLSGGGYADTYIFNLGDGQDIVDDDNQFILGQGFVTIDTTPDILRFGAGITSADISITYDSNHITLGIGSNGDAVTLHGQNDYYHTGVFGAISNSRIERIEFADGEVWTWQELNQRAIASATTAGDDLIIGFDLEDRFEASAGNDIMRGGDSGDTYVFGIGSGSDRIEETVSNANFDDDDKVEFEAGIAASDVSFSRNGEDLIVSIAGTTDQLTIVNQFENYVGFTNNDVESFHFADGTVISKAQIMADLTVGSAGDDVIYGFYTNDTIIGGQGNDILRGLDGSDRYEFNLGDGQDTIYESVEYANIADDDRIVFGAGILPGDIDLSRSGNALTLSIAGTTDSITISGQFAFQSWFSWNDVEFFEFADGTEWTKRDVANMLLGGTSGDDTLIGTFSNDELDGQGGNDILRGGDGSDIYYFGLGYGSDRIEETITDANLSDFDQIVFASGINTTDLIYTRVGDNLIIDIAGTSDQITIAGQFDNYIGYTNRDIEQLQFADGSIVTKLEIQAILTVGTSADEEILGFHTSDILDGGAGNDILRGLDGSDTYLFGRGSGNDIIRESVQYVNISDNDRVLFAPDLSLSDISFSPSGDTLVISINDTTDTLTIENGLAVEGGTVSYTWRDVENFEFADGTVLSKTDVQNILLTPTDGDDTIVGFWTSDILAGGLGNDLLQGGRGNDGYLYNVGDGHDTISDFRITFGNDGDYVSFGPGISPADIVVRATPSNRNDMIVDLPTHSGSVTLVNQLTENNEWTIDELRFADGTVLTDQDLLTRYLVDQISVGDDTIVGLKGGDVLDGLSGDDTIYGWSGNDTLIGGLGNDTLRGETGNDTYVYVSGDGDDTIDEIAGQGTADKLLLQGIDAARITFETYRDSNDVAIVIAESTPGAGNAGRIQILASYSTQSDSGIETVELDDGTIYTKSDIATLAISPDLDETLYGTDSADTLVGGRGDDWIDGKRGNDLYIYSRGDGHDVLNEYRYHGSDRLRIHSVDPNVASLVRDGVNVTLFIAESSAGAGDDGSIRLNGGSEGSLVNSGGSGFEYIEFDDGTVWNHATMRDMIFAATATAGDDYVNGFDSGDTMYGGLGNDTIYGQRGNDVFVYNRGDGSDTIYEYRYHDTDRLRLHGIDPADVSLVRQGNDVDLVIAESSPGAGDGGMVALRGTALYSDGGSGVQYVDFDDGTVWTQNDLRARVLNETATPGADYVNGFDTGDVMYGGLGDDTIRGRRGDDTYLYARGDGNDNIGDYKYEGNDRLHFTDILQNEVIFYSSGIHLYAKIVDSSAGAGDGGIISLWESNNTSSIGVDSFQFGDNSVLSDDQVLTQKWSMGTSSSDTWTGGTGNDRYFADYGDDELTGGLGNDTLNGSYGSDTAVYSGLSAEYTMLTSGGNFQLRDDETAVGEDEGTDTLIGIETLRFGNGQTVGITSPIILDLDGDGIETVSASQSDAKFDLDGDGLADDTSWIGAGDAFLYLDRDGNGTMSGAGEISFIDDVPNAASDLAGLRAFDSNGDGILDARDERFAEFGVWRDADGDGAVDEGETASLAAVGIASIGLTGTAVEGASELGDVAIVNTGSFTLTNGATRQFADAALTYFSAATNLPELAVSHYDFARKSKKYRMSIAGGAISVVPKKAVRGMDPLAGQLGANTIIGTSNGTYGMFAPVVLDLDGDGIELVKRSKTGAAFDYNGDGVGDDTGWVSGDDGFLVIDRNNDGRITEASELSLASENTDARSGLQGLAWLDSDGNGVIDVDDARFGELRVWQDRNGNGRTDAGELMSLEQAGIVSVRLTSVSAVEDMLKLDNNAVVATASFVRANGTTSTAADVSLAYRPSSGGRSSGGYDLLPGNFDLPLNSPWLGDMLGFRPRLPDRDAIFDMLREDRVDELRALFGDYDILEPTGILPPVETDRGSAAIGWQGTDTTEAGSQRLHVMPDQLVSIDALNGDVFASLEPGSEDAELARKLAMIRQDMGSFGASWAGEAGRLYQPMPAYLELHA